VLTHEPSSPSPREVLAGLVERVTFHHADSGFCVLRVKARGHRDLITVIGHAAVIAAGEWVTAFGAWVNDRTHCRPALKADLPILRCRPQAIAPTKDFTESNRTCRSGHPRENP
jgi:hypothetical protein